MHPEKVKSQQGTFEYRFSKADIEAFKAQEALNAEQTRQDRTEETGHGRQDQTGQDGEVITLLKETTGLLKEQLVKKDEQIKDLGGKIDQLIERDRETNILIGQLQSKVLMLEKPKEPINGDAEETGHNPEETGHNPEETGQDKAGETGQDKPAKKGFIEKVKDFFKEKK